MKTLEKLIANLPILDFYYVLTGRIDKIFPDISYLSKRVKLLAQLEHLAYMPLGFLVTLLMGGGVALTLYAACFLIFFPLELFLMRKASRVVTWEWARNKSYKAILSVYGWVPIDITSYYIIGVCFPFK